MGSWSSASWAAGLAVAPESGSGVAGPRNANEGDLDGAIAELREHIEEKGPTQIRLNALGILLMRREKWDEAAALFRKGEQMGELQRGICRANLGLALLKGGKPAEAIPVLQEAARIGPHVTPMTCIINLHMCLAWLN